MNKIPDHKVAVHCVECGHEYGVKITKTIAKVVDG